MSHRAGFHQIGEHWWKICGLFLLFSIGVRAVHFASPPWFDQLDYIEGWYLWATLISLFIHLSLVAFYLGSFITLVLLILFRFQWCFNRTTVGWQLRLWLRNLLWTGLALTNVIFDFHPVIAYFCGFSLLGIPLLLRNFKIISQKKTFFWEISGDIFLF